MRYRKSNGLFYWIGCIQFATTYVFTAPAATGPWTQRASINNCYYDAGLLIDDNDTMYVAHGNTQIMVSQLSADGLSEVSTKTVFNSPSSIGTLEGSRMYKYNGRYYIFNTMPASAQYVLMSTNGPFGPYTAKKLLSNIAGPTGGGVPHQGSLVDTPNGNWYYMAFEDSYPGGRMPVLAPITWGSDGYPVLQTVNGAWGTNYNYPMTASPVPAPYTTDYFNGTSLGPEWEWNHNPDATKYTVNNGLTLHTATVTNDLYAARNTLTHRILGPTSSGTLVFNYASMANGDRAGLSLFRDSSAWIGIINSGGKFRVSFWSGMTLDNSKWTTTSTGSEITSVPITNVGNGKIWFRVYVNTKPGANNVGTFYYSFDGAKYVSLGSLKLNTAWQYFIGYRYGIINFAAAALGGSIAVESFGVDFPGKNGS